MLIFVADYTNTCVADCRNGPGLIAAKSFLVVLSVSIPTGYVMLTSVPPNEFDIDKWFDTDTSSGLRAFSKSLVRLLSISALLIGGIYIFIIPFPFVIGLPIIAYAIWVLWEITPRETNELRRRCGLSIVQSAVNTLPAREQPEWLRLSKPSHITTVIAGAIFCIVSGGSNLSLMNIVGDTPSSPFYLGVLSRPIVQSRVLINGAAAAIGILGLIAMLYTWRAAAAHGAANGRGWWRTAALYEFISLSALTYAAGNFCLSFATQPVGDFIGQVGTATILAGVGLWGRLGGRALVFRAAARQFESSHRISDGAKLAALVARAPAIDWATRSRWIMRRGGSRGSSKLESDAARGCVNRNFWLLGHIVALDSRSGSWVAQPPPSAGKPDPEELCLQIFFAEDADEQWTAHFSSDKLVLQRLAASARDFFSAEQHFVARAATGDEFSAWRKISLWTTDLVDKNVGDFNQSVVVRVTNLGGTADEAEMASVAQKNLRFFPFPRTSFPHDLLVDLLVTSPRNVLESDAESVFNRSRPLDLTLPANSGRLVDFFLSHCWDEDEEGARKKASALQAFVNKIAPQSKNAAAREVSLWFDKVCIDKRKGADDRAITLLPVTVGMCRKVIVLLSPNYLKRIWCVWEIESIFTFCIKELAVDRVVVVNAGGGANLRRDALRWSLDAAHCFDPNEELRLRRLAVVIGEDRFVESVQTLSMCPVIDAANLMQELES